MDSTHREQEVRVRRAAVDINPQQQRLPRIMAVGFWRKHMLTVEIRVKRRIDRRWSEWLDDLTITHSGRDETILTGAVADQSALYGLVAKLRDLGLPLLSVNVLQKGNQEATAS